MVWTLRITITAFVLFTLFGDFTAHSGEDTDDMSKRERRALHYTCRLKSGEVISTTERKIADDISVPKAKVFHRETEGEPIIMETGESLKDASAEGEKTLQTFQPVLAEKLYKVAEGLKMGDERNVTVEAEAQLDLPDEERNIQLSRVRTVPKEMRYEKDAFPHITTSEAKVGSAVKIHQALEGRVISVNENEVVVNFTPVSEKPLEGPFGPYLIHDKGDNYEIEIDARIGSLVRVGPLVGRISEVGATMFNVDYSHPFGGEALYCNVAVRPAPDEVLKTRTAERKAEEASGSEVKADQNAASPCSGCSGAGEKQKREGSEEAAQVGEENPEIVQQGDLVEVSYTASLETGEVFWTTQPSVAEDLDREKVDWYEAQEYCGPEALLAGEEGAVPGLGDALLGMRMGEKKRIVVPASEAYGPRDAKWLGEFVRDRSIPRIMTLPAESYIKQYGGFPVKDKTLDVNPYVMGRIVEVKERDVTLELTPKAETDESELGTTSIKVVADRIELVLTPKIGAPFPFQDRNGRIIAVGDKKFTVDFNHPLAGKPIVLDIEITSLTKASSFRNKEIEWIEDHDEGLDMAASERKPVVLVLYAEWCKWSKKLLEESLKDPRIKLLKDSFIWVKVDSHEQKDIKDFYEQKGFPMIVLMGPEGSVIRKLGGFKEPEALQQELKQLMENRKAEHDEVPQTGLHGHASTVLQGK